MLEVEISRHQVIAQFELCLKFLMLAFIFSNVQYG